MNLWVLVYSNYVCFCQSVAKFGLASWVKDPCPPCVSSSHSSQWDLFCDHLCSNTSLFYWAKKITCSRRVDLWKRLFSRKTGTYKALYKSTVVHFLLWARALPLAAGNFILVSSGSPFGPSLVPSFTAQLPSHLSWTPNFWLCHTERSRIRSDQSYSLLPIFISVSLAVYQRLLLKRDRDRKP